MWWLMTLATAMDLQQAVLQAQQEHPRVSQARASVAIAEAEVARVQPWFSNPQLQTNGRSDVLFGRQGELSIDVDVVQPLVWPGVRMARVSAAEQQVAAQRHLLELQQLQVMANVERAWARWMAAHAAETLRASLSRMMDDLAAATFKRQQAGLVSEVEVRLVRAERAMAAAQMLDAGSARGAAHAQLCASIGMDVCETDASSWPVLSALPVDDGARLDVEGAQAQARAADDRASAEAQARIPSLQLGLGYTFDRGYVAAPNDPSLTSLDADHFAGMTLALGLPVWDWNNGAVREAEAQGAQARAQAAALVLEGRADVSAARGRWQAANDAAAALDAVADDIAQALRDIAAAHAASGLTLAEALASRDRLVRVQLETIAAHERVMQAHADVLVSLANGSVLQSSQTEGGP
jgi:outer membrane protein TolC